MSRLRISNSWLTFQCLRMSSTEVKESSFTASQADETERRVVPRPVGYMPDHLPQMRSKLKIKPWWRYKEFITINALPDGPPEWTDRPQYPALVDNSREGIKKRIRLEWYDAIKALPTAEQKIFEISKHYRHLNFMLEPVMKQYNSLPLIQFITRTHVIHKQLPQPYVDMDVNHILDRVKKEIVDGIALHLFDSIKRKPSLEFKNSFMSLFGPINDDHIRLEMAKQEDAIEEVVKIIRKVLNSDYEHLKTAQMDLSANVRTSWWHKDFPRPLNLKRWFPSESIDQCFTYSGTHALHMRCDKPLPQILPFDDPICVNSEIASYKYNLVKLGYYLRRNSIACLPGFWPDRSYGFDFPYLMFHSRVGLKIREVYNETSYNDTQEVIDGMAVLSSFGWLSSLAANLGFTVYQHLTYPLVTQAIVTDGQFWSFYVYQLNNHAFHSDVDTNALKNVCWTSGDLKLFDSYQNNQLIGVDDNVLKLIIKFLIREPQLQENVDLRPYLSVDNRSEDDIKELSYSLRRKSANYVSTFVSTRQRVHDWEKIYKYHPDACPTPHLRQRPKMNFKYPPFYTH